MNKSNLFKQAHALTKATIQAGDSYSATFALCLKAVYAQSAQINTIHVEKKELLKWTYENGMSFGTAKNGSHYAEVIIDSPAFDLLKKGLKIIATRSKTGSVTTYEFSGEYGKEFFDYHHNKKVRFYGTEVVKLANK